MTLRYKFYYFNVRAKGEICRLAFAATNTEFEDIRLSGEEWAKEKESGRPPFGQMPFIVAAGKCLSQSNAIMKYICKQAGLCPKDSFEEAKADMIADSTMDLRNGFVKFHFEKDEAIKEELKKEFFGTTLPARLKCFEAFLKGTDYFVENKLTYADITFFDFNNGFLAHGKPEVPEELKTFPLLSEHYKRVLSNPGIKAWVEKRPESSF